MISKMNAEIEARLRPAPEWQTPEAVAAMNDADRAAYDAGRAEWRVEWGHTFGRGSDDLRYKYGLVPCGDAPGWRFA